MGWERRKRGGWYYTRSQRVGGRVRREYVPLAVAAFVAETDAQERVERERKRLAKRTDAERRHATEAAFFGPLDALDVACRAAIRQELEAAGYHQHARGAWRRRRGESTGQTTEPRQQGADDGADD